LSPLSRRRFLLCVERDAAACHRSLVANWLAKDEAIVVEHIVPGE
jgi:hypothetical protein